MSYFKDLIEMLRSRFPLHIDKVEWDGTLYYMGGIDWHFNAFSYWAVVTDEIMVIGCHDNEIDSFINTHIREKEIIDLQPSLDLPSYDPIFVLSNKIKIKFFSTLIVDPWTLKFGDNHFVASPSDDEWVLMDKEG
jgi:hypothetical protein